MTFNQAAVFTSVDHETEFETHWVINIGHTNVTRGWGRGGEGVFSFLLLRLLLPFIQNYYT